MIRDAVLIHSIFTYISEYRYLLASCYNTNAVPLTSVTESGTKTEGKEFYKGKHTMSMLTAYMVNSSVSNKLDLKECILK